MHLKIYRIWFYPPTIAVAAIDRARQIAGLGRGAAGIVA
jgi:hypothetical protein